MSKAEQKYVKAEKGDAQGLAWSFPNKETLKPELYAYKHPELQANEVRIKVSYFALGDMDVELLKSKQIDVFVPGHEVVGTIEAIGKDVGMRKVGEVVGLGFIKSSCKDCTFCFRGKQQLCQKAKNSMTIFPDIGGYGTHVHAEADWVFPIPNNIPLSEASPLLCAGAIAYNVVSTEFKRLQHQIKRQMRIGIVGMGAIGHMAAKFANKFGFEVTIFSHTPEKQVLLKQNGVQFKDFISQNVEDFDKNKGRFDLVMLTGDIPNELVQKCVYLARRGAKMCLISYFKGQVSLIGTSIIVDQREVSGIKGASKENIFHMLETVSHSIFQNDNTLLPICEHYSFMEFETAFDKIKKNEARFRGVVKVEDDLVDKYNKGEKL